MDIWNSIGASISECLNNIPLTITALLALLTLLFVLQLYLRAFVWRIPRVRTTTQNPEDIGANLENPAISVVVVVHERDEDYIENYLPLILNQDYSAFEVIVVDCSYDEFIGQRLQILGLEHSHLRVTTLRKGSGFDNCEKLAINIGFKAALYNNLLLTSSKAYPTSDKWIASMAISFSHKKHIVLGFSTIEPTDKRFNRFTRCARIYAGMGYINAAIKGKAYRGSRHNMAYTKDTYFENKGFNYLNMNIGENDLFVQKIASPTNVAVNISAQAAVKEYRFDSMREVFDNDVLRSTAHKLYPSSVKNHKNLELFSRTGFNYLALFLIFWCAIAAISGQIFIPIYIGLLAMLIIRLAVVMITAHKASARLHDKGLTLFFPVFDFLSPLYELRVWTKRTFSHNRSVWR